MTMQSERIRKKLSFLIDVYKMKYEELVFNTDKSGSFLGPMYAYCFYNENGAFVLYYALQRNEWYFYTSDKYSRNQEELLKVDVSDRVYALIKSTKAFRFSEISKLSLGLEKQLQKVPLLFGIRLDKV